MGKKKKEEKQTKLASRDPVVRDHLQKLEDAASGSREEFLKAVKAVGADETLSRAQRLEIMRFLARGQAEGLRRLSRGALFSGSGGSEQQN